MTGMGPKGRPGSEYRSAQHEGSPVAGRHLAILAGTAVLPFRDGIAAAVTTPWDVVAIPDDLSTSVAVIARADAAVTGHYDATWPTAPRLKLLQVAGAGYDRIDIKAIPPGVTLCNVFEHEPGVSEYALLAMLEWCHRLGPADRQMRTGVWTRSSRFGGAPDEDLAGKTLVIVGLGRIGAAVARRARAFDMRVLAVNRSAGKTDPNVERVVGLDQLNQTLSEADFVVLACALVPETRGLIGTAELASMKPGALIVNPARGAVIDEAALFDALLHRRIGGAAIDTWWDYPSSAAPRDPSTRFPFHKLDNVLLSPHVAGWTTGTIVRRSLEIARNLDRLARGEPLSNTVVTG
ncbi:MAG: 2-hydroxyacid dehydrogenase [Betaproteobacteria bacterium]